MTTRIARPRVALLAHMSPLIVVDQHPSLRCRLGLHHYVSAGTAPDTPWMVLADECACGAQRPLPL